MAGNEESWILPALLINTLVLGTLLVLHLSALLEIYRGLPTRRRRDVSADGHEPPREVLPIIEQLRALGFERLGEVEVTLPDLSGIGPLLRRRHRHTSWALVDSQDTTSAEVVAIGPSLAFGSMLADGSSVATYYPAGPAIDDAHLFEQAVPTGVAEAYDAHRLAIDRRADAHGLPGELHNMADFMRQDEHYRRRYARRALRPAVVRNALISTGVTVVVYLALTALLLWLPAGAGGTQ